MRGRGFSDQFRGGICVFNRYTKKLNPHWYLLKTSISFAFILRHTRHNLRVKGAKVQGSPGHQPEIAEKNSFARGAPNALWGAAKLQKLPVGGARAVEKTLLATNHRLI